MSPFEMSLSSPPKIVRISKTKEYESLMMLVDARAKMDVRSFEHEVASKHIEAMITDLRDKGILCECSEECTDLRGLGSPKKLF